MVMRTPLPKVSRRGRVTLIVLACVVALSLLLGWVVNTWTDWLWYSEVGYTQVFTHLLWTRVGLFLVFGLVVAAIVAANLYLAWRLRPPLRPHSPEQQTLDRYRMVVTPRIGLWVSLVGLVIGFFAGLSAQGRWPVWLLFANSQPFGSTDPQFGKDISFYVFQYPFWRYLVGVGFTTVVLSLIGSLAVHYLFGGVRLQGAGDRMTFAARAHLTALVAVFVLLKAVAYFLDQRGLLLAHNGGTNLWGAGYTDVNALLPAKEILQWISVVVAVAIIVFSNAVIRNLVWPGIALALLAISAIAIGGIYPAAVQTFTVKPNIRDKEAPFIQRSIDATRQAFGLADLKTVPYPVTVQKPPPELATDADTVPNIRLLDPAVVADTFTQRQQVRGFYDFGQKLDIDRYTVGGKTQDYVIGIRELDYNNLSSQQNNWQNRHTVFTHGYGFVGAPADQIVCGGQPYFVSGFLGNPGENQATQDNEACSSATDQIPTTQPRIYYGEGMNDYVIVGRAPGANDAEYDRPSGASDQYVTYDGKGGISVGSYWRRVLYAAKYKETNFLISSIFNKNSKLLYVRDPRERVEKVAPFLTMDGDPYPAVVNNRIVWILDGYTTATTYPYSEQIDLRGATSDALTGSGTFAQERQDVNYLRNSVKATVDAYDGTVTLYQFDDADPVLKAWNKAFGGNLVKPKSEIPPELAAHFRYPEDQFKVQRELLTRFHVTDARQFFSGQDFWQVPADPANESAGLKQPPYYLLAKFPGQNATTFQLTAAMTPRSRANLAALITASYQNGKPTLEVLQLPSDTQIFGPIQVHQTMQNNPDVRRDVSLFNSQNSDVIYGNLLSLPVAGGMLYVEPLYIKSKAENSYPLMKKVLLNYGQYVAYADTLDQGIQQLLQQAAGASSGTPKPPSGNGQQNQSDAVSQAAAKIQKAIDDLRSAQQSGDFTAYGKALQELDDAVKQYENAQKAAGGASGGSTSPQSPGPSPSAGG
ncbi:MAG TPA: UPF0182 family protein [Micromonosporaceae bacterium]